MEWKKGWERIDSVLHDFSRADVIKEMHCKISQDPMKAAIFCSYGHVHVHPRLALLISQHQETQIFLVGSICSESSCGECPFFLLLPLSERLTGFAISMHPAGSPCFKKILPCSAVIP